MSKDTDITEKSWEEWLNLPQTKALRRWAEAERLRLMEQWATGTFTASFDIEMMAKNAGATGAVSVYDQVREMDFEQITKGIEDGK